MSLTAPAAFARNGGNGTPKETGRTGERPVARLIGTVYTGEPAPERPRQATRVYAPAPAAATRSYAPAPVSAAAVGATGDERRAFDLINRERQRMGLSPLAWDGDLVRLARYHSQNMARGGYLSHVERDGLDLKGRAQALGLHGWKTLGENIAYNQGYDDPTAFAVERWMISQQHRENALSPEYTHAGVGIARAADGTYYFTQVFMRR
ncbi:MAG: CAP domain-containing protein [Acidobacteria bacterium]|nr:CAP domain-containing protein [Acidobacteriota bacterium]